MLKPVGRGSSMLQAINSTGPTVNDAGTVLTPGDASRDILAGFLRWRLTDACIPFGPGESYSTAAEITSSLPFDQQ